MDISPSTSSKHNSSTCSKKSSIRSDNTPYISMYTANDDIELNIDDNEYMDIDICDKDINENDNNDSNDMPLRNKRKNEIHLSIDEPRKDSILSQRQSVQMDLFLENFVKPSYDDNIDDLSTASRTLSTRVIKKSKPFNMLIIGDEGIGKSSYLEYIRNKLNSKTSSMTDSMSQSMNNKISDEFCEENMEFGEKSSKIFLNVLTVPNYGTKLNNDPIFTDISSYIESTFIDYFKTECSVNRKYIVDRKIHVCLYFLSPFGHGLKPLDIKFLETYHSKLNILLVIGRADCFTQSELRKFKENVIGQLKERNINLMPYINAYDKDDEEFLDFNQCCVELNESIPFVVISPKEPNSSRQYPWGTLDLNSYNSTLLENFLFRTHTQFFRRLTDDYFYENFRSQYILDKYSNDR